ncbi:MAG: DegT/DnrJ/EryC1/StrS family aminotransferase [Solobacterium sp.]|nr:DegT/DnrJ/EryC1/StrS family aminotransferase [Solobacterium sp.]
MNIMANNLKRMYDQHADEFEAKALEVLRSGWYILGNELRSFENEFAQYIGSKYCVGLASGLDALWIAFRALGIGAGDEVIVSSNSYIACVMGITMNNASPVFVEPDQYGNLDAEKIEEKITDKTKAILAVHLYGQSCDMTKIMELAHKYDLKVVEDCAQSHGTEWKGRKTGTFADIACFSFYPTKNLGAFGDGGAITTDDEGYADAIRTIRNYGSKVHYQNEVVGTNSRLDELQAGLLRVKLKYLDELNAERMALANRYDTEVHNPWITYLPTRPGSNNIYHQYEILSPCRDELIEYLLAKGIHTIIHYPIPPHLSNAYKYLGFVKGDLPIAEKYADTILSLPMYNGMTEEEQTYVIEALNAFRTE